MRKQILLAAAILLAFAAGLYLGGRRIAIAHAASAAQYGRPSLAAIPTAWGTVRGTLGRDEITLILEDQAGTIRAVTLEKALNDKGEPAVRPRLFATVPRD